MTTSKSKEEVKDNIVKLYKLISMCKNYTKAVKFKTVKQPMLEALNNMIDEAEEGILKLQGIKPFKNSGDLKLRMKAWCSCTECTCSKEDNKEARKHGWKRVINKDCPVHGYLYEGSDSSSN